MEKMQFRSRKPRYQLQHYCHLYVSSPGNERGKCFAESFHGRGQQWGQLAEFRLFKCDKLAQRAWQRRTPQTAARRVQVVERKRR